MKSKPRKDTTREEREDNFEEFIRQRAEKIYKEICEILEGD